MKIRKFVERKNILELREIQSDERVILINLFGGHRFEQTKESNR